MVEKTHQLDKVVEFARKRSSKLYGHERAKVLALVHERDTGPFGILDLSVDSKWSDEESERRCVEFAAEAFGAARDHVAAHIGQGGAPQRYSIAAYDAAGHNKAHYSWALTPPLPAAEGLGATEAPNATGERAQAMRHTEEAWRMADRAMSRLEQINSKLMDHVQNSEEKRLAQAETLISLLTKIGELEAARMKANVDIDEQRRNGERIDRLFSIVETKVVPGIVEKYSPLGNARAFLESLSPEQTSAFLATLTPEQLPKFKDLVDAINNVRKEAPPAPPAGSLPSTTNGVSVGGAVAPAPANVNGATS